MQLSSLHKDCIPDFIKSVPAELLNFVYFTNLNHENKDDLLILEDLITFTNWNVINVWGGNDSLSYYNKIIANMHEMYSFLTKEIEKNYKKETLLENYHKILICMMPIIPHFANECLELLRLKKTNWPKHDLSLLKNEMAGWREKHSYNDSSTDSPS